MLDTILEHNGLNNMGIEKLIVGELSENCYIITKNNKTVIIDPGAEPQKIIDACKDKNVVGVLITHHHFDHVGALHDLEKYFNIKESNIISGFDYEVISTPGHTKDSVTYYFKQEKVMFTGDFIFNGSIGRYDLPSGSYNDILESISKIYVYPDDIIIYPGHGNVTTLKKEKTNLSYYLN